MFQFWNYSSHFRHSLEYFRYVQQSVSKINGIIPGYLTCMFLDSQTSSTALLDHFIFAIFPLICLLLYMFDFRLRVFYTVARRLSFTKAAEELLISQPAVTKHIKELEREFNLAFFDRRGNKVLLSPVGEVLLKHTEAMQEIYRRMEFDLNQLDKAYKGMLHVGSSTSICLLYTSPSPRDGL